MADITILGQLRTKIEEFHSLKRVNAHLSDVSDNLSNKYKELDVITKQLKKEEKDVIQTAFL